MTIEVKNLIKKFGAFAATLAAFALAGGASAQQTVKIGAIYPLSGNAASAGNFSKAAIELAVDLINNGNPNLKDLPLADGDGQILHSHRDDDVLAGAAGAGNEA